MYICLGHVAATLEYLGVDAVCIEQALAPAQLLQALEGLGELPIRALGVAKLVRDSTQPDVRLGHVCVLVQPARQPQRLASELAGPADVVLLDAQNRVLASEEMFRGTLTQTSVYPREVVKTALRHNAASVIFAHNHPSGVTEPSHADQLLTQSLKQALALVDIKVLDHFIVAGGSALSMAERGML